MPPIADAKRVAELIDALAGVIERDMSGRGGHAAAGQPWALVGIRSRGDVLARRLAAKLRPNHVGTLDITLYRDDLSEVASQPIVRTTEVPFAIDGLDVVLVDDVLMTGRSVRAALQSLMDLGRPRRVWLSVLVDRGGRELPIAADHVALDLTRDVGRDQLVDVRLQPLDDVDAIETRPRDTARQDKEGAA
jgi:pyrimidine operon attenuation protein / uracil phosphoribosyltransferase